MTLQEIMIDVAATAGAIAGICTILAHLPFMPPAWAERFARVALYASQAFSVNRRDTLPKDDDQKAKPPSVPPFAACLCIALLVLPSCGLFAAAAPYLAEAAVIIADASNAVSAAESTHLIDPDLIARARAALAAAAKADDGLHDLTAEQLDASLADFRAAWAEIRRVYATKRIGAAEGGVGLPVPLAVRRTHK